MQTCSMGELNNEAGRLALSFLCLGTWSAKDFRDLSLPCPHLPDFFPDSATYPVTLTVTRFDDGLNSGKMEQVQCSPPGA